MPAGTGSETFANAQNLRQLVCANRAQPLQHQSQSLMAMRWPPWVTFAWQGGSSLLAEFTVPMLARRIEWQREGNSLRRLKPL